VGRFSFSALPYFKKQSKTNFLVLLSATRLSITGTETAKHTLWAHHRGNRFKYLFRKSFPRCTARRICKIPADAEK
jgi:hypothetical protein